MKHNVFLIFVVLFKIRIRLLVSVRSGTEPPYPSNSKFHFRNILIFTKIFHLILFIFKICLNFASIPQNNQSVIFLFFVLTSPKPGPRPKYIIGIIVIQ